MKTLDVPPAPQFVLVRPDGQVAYVSCDRSAQVAEIDLREWTLTRLIDAGPMADGLAWAAAAPRPSPRPRGLRRATEAPQARSFLTTLPYTSVSRKSRPWKR